MGIGAPSATFAASTAPHTDENVSSVTTSPPIVKDGAESTDPTAARTDSIAPGSDDTIVDGSRIVGRPAIPVTLSVDRTTRVLHVAPTTVRGLLAAQHVRVGDRDDVTPPLDSALEAHDFVRIVHVKMWTARVRRQIAANVRLQHDARLARGHLLTLERGRPGLSEITYRYARRGDGTTERTAIAARIVRTAHPRVVVLGTAAPSLARVAEQGFESAVRIASSALHMIATAYTAGCAGCSGITASGVRAGFGVIAVDPRVIPLGTKLFIPGYGRAVAGDTGGAILGNRVDLGMSTNQAALQFGRRSVTVYVLR
ncbi:MAG: hypothetical protein NVS1B2_17080 [Vulcanimicrobiaceae bacterium]